MRSSRWLPAVVCAAVVACAPGPTTTPGPASASPAAHRFEGEGISFDYPAAWQPARFEVISSFSSAIVYLSTAPLSDPCDRTPSSIACVRTAVAGLGPNGILVVWSRQAWPGWTFDPTRGRLLQVDGRRATIEATPPDDSCRSIAGERVLDVTIDDAMPDSNWTEMRACLRGPALDALQAQVEAMLATVRWQG